MKIRQLNVTPVHTEHSVLWTYVVLGVHRTKQKALDYTRRLISNAKYELALSVTTKLSEFSNELLQSVK